MNKKSVPQSCEPIHLKDHFASSTTTSKRDKKQPALWQRCKISYLNIFLSLVIRPSPYCSKDSFVSVLNASNKMHFSPIDNVSWKNHLFQFYYPEFLMNQLSWNTFELAAGRKYQSGIWLCYSIFFAFPMNQNSYFILSFFYNMKEYPKGEKNQIFI